MDSRLPQPLRGIIPPLVTPLSGPDTLDVPGLERLIEHVLAGGVHGLFILGTTGEAPSLSYRLRRELISRACQQVAGRVPVLVGITDTSFVESVQLAGHAADAGAQAVVLSAPYYFPSGQAELLQYLDHITRKLPLPMFLYNMPAMTKVAFSPETVREAMAFDGIVGLKDSSGDMAYFEQVRELARRRPEWSLLIGPEQLLRRSLELGGHGGVCGGANVWPSLFVDLFDAHIAGDRARCDTLQRAIERLDQLYRIGQHSSATIKGVKCALATLGICDDFMAEPFQRFSEPERRRVAQLMRDLRLGPIGEVNHAP